jgi:hypothetical protein
MTHFGMADDLPVHETDSTIALFDFTMTEAETERENSVVQIMSTTQVEGVSEGTVQYNRAP